jgi:hypothetical protein
MRPVRRRVVVQRWTRHREIVGDVFLSRDVSYIGSELGYEIEIVELPWRTSCFCWKSEVAEVLHGLVDGQHLSIVGAVFLLGRVQFLGEEGEGVSGDLDTFLQYGTHGGSGGCEDLSSKWWDESPWLWGRRERHEVVPWQHRCKAVIGCRSLAWPGSGGAGRGQSWRWTTLSSRSRKLFGGHLVTEESDLGCSKNALRRVV